MFSRFMVFAAVSALCLFNIHIARADYTFNVEFDGHGDLRWEPIGSAGIDFNAGYSFRGYNNGWVRASQGWNALAMIEPFSGGGYGHCNAQAWIRGSDNVQNVYMSFIDALTGEVVSERGPLAGRELYDRIGNSGYQLIVMNPISINSQNSKRLMKLRIGFWGNGQDAWIQIDDVMVYCF